MRRTALAGLLLVLTACQSTGQRQADPPLDGWTLHHVVDGDTAWVKRPLREKVRFLRIDTPERNEWGYNEATNELKRLIPANTPIRLEYEDQRRDDFGRLLAYVWVKDKLVNVEMVRLGWSAFFDRYGTGRHAEKFKLAETEAKLARRGIWANH